MQRMYGVEMQVPAGKRPGFYAQVIHKIGDHVNVFDRDGRLLIVESPQERDTLKDLLQKAGMLGEEFALWLLPEAAEFDYLDDVGFVSQSEHAYLYADRVAAFSFDSAAGEERDRWAALEQCREHVIGTLPPSTSRPALYLVDAGQTELIEGIARAYQTAVTWWNE
jgi:hypothetical protein